MTKSGAFKFLSAGRGLFSDFVWPLPDNGTPGRWIKAELPLERCIRGIHVCREPDLPYWIDDELWVIEVRGDIVEHETMMLAEEGRLVRGVESWDKEAALTFAQACAHRAQGFAVDALRNAVRTDDASALAKATTFESIRDAAAMIMRKGADNERGAVSFAADAAALALGARPEAADTPAETGGSATPGAVAANLAYVTAHVAGAAAGPPGTSAYDRGVERERDWQREWFRDLVNAVPTGG
ncbi:MAG: hypothetical protein H0W90_12730 [Actinobacteria bacterium]|nr:hypothetical protein [Actinomycetota bacterium]